MVTEPKKGTQHYAILEYLRTGKTLTGLDALNLCGSMKAATRISELKDMGHNIQSETIETSSGKHVKRYWLSDEPSDTPQEEAIRHSNLGIERQAFEKNKQYCFIG